MTNQAATSGTSSPPRYQYYIDSFTVFFFGLCGGLALNRILYEALFPQLSWLGRPLVALPSAALFAFLVWIIWQYFDKVTRRQSDRVTPSPLHPLTLSPLLLNILWLFDPTVDLIRSRLIFAASVWLTAVLLTNFRYWGLEIEDIISANLQSPISNLQSQIERRWRWLGLVFVIAALLPIYLLTMSHSVGAADTFEFQVVTPQLGIVHPTGYPSYLLLGKLFTLLPFGSLAWRLNFASVIYALAAVSLLYELLLRLLSRPLPAILTAVVSGLTVTLWGQAIIAEVYALQALVVMTAVFLMAEIGDWRLEIFEAGKQKSSAVSLPGNVRKESLVVLLALVIGLGMTNHLTSIFLIPPAILTCLFTIVARRNSDTQLPITNSRFYLKIGAAFLLPLLLYAYLPLRWQAVNGEAMGLARFIDWVVAGRFQGALQLRAWLDDPARYEIVGRLFLENWGWFNLLLAGFGFVILLGRSWQTAAVLGSLWFGTTFYALNYYVPDLAVFVIPAQLVVGMCWGMGVYTIFEIGDWRLEIGRYRISNLQSLIATFIIIPALLLAVDHWLVNDQSGDNALEEWGRAVLGLPLAENGAILADSEKIAPLNYLQIAEGLRPDLDISVWPDEAAYRQQINGRLAAGQKVYLARQIPGLQHLYHLRSVGPLTEVYQTPISQLPNLPITQTTNLQFGPISLIGYQIEPATAVTFYWQAAEPVTQVLHVYVKLEGFDDGDGRHPANNFYPTNAWRPGEIVSDYHELPLPLVAEPQPATLQVALAPPFTPPAELEWQSVTQFELPATADWAGGRPYRAQLGNVFIAAAAFPGQTRPQTPLPLLVSGYGAGADLEFWLSDSNQLTVSSNQSFAVNRLPKPDDPFALSTALPPELGNGRYYLTAQAKNSPAMCGWMRPLTTACVLGEVEISGVALPETAVNFGDKIALLETQISNRELRPGGLLEVDISWLALADMAEDYTITVQVLDANDRLVGQTDSWPLQGTFPTSQWRPGETIADPYTIQLDPDLSTGDYRLLVGIYLLADGRRLPVINDDGTAVDDKLLLPGLFVP